MFSSNQQLKYSTQKQKVVELINSDSRDAGLPFHVLCKEESRLVIALDHLTLPKDLLAEGPLGPEDLVNTAEGVRHDIQGAGDKLREKDIPVLANPQDGLRDVIERQRLCPPPTS